MRLAVADAGNDPAGSTTRRAYDLLAEGFGAGVNGPLVVVIETPDAAAAAAVPRVLDAVAATPGVAMVTESVASPSGAIAVAQVYPTTAPQSEVTEQLVRHLRDDVLPEAAGAPASCPTSAARPPPTSTSPRCCPPGSRGSSAPCSS